MFFDIAIGEIGHYVETGLEGKTLTAETAKAWRIDELSRDPQTGKQNPKAKKEAEAIMQAEPVGWGEVRTPT